MPVLSTQGSFTAYGYRRRGDIQPGDSLWNDVVLLLQPQPAETSAYDDKSDNSTTVDRTRGSNEVTLSTSVTDPFGYGLPVINYDCNNSQLITVDQVADEIANSTNPDTWTIEGWFRTTSITSQHVLFGFNGNTFSPDQSPNVDNVFNVWVANNATTLNVIGSYLITQINGVESPTLMTWTPSLNTWYHVAAVNNGGIVTVYVDGVSRVSQNLDTINSGDSFQIGADQDGVTTNDFFCGQVYDLRVTINQARYTTTFTPPTSPFPRSTGALPGSYASLPAKTETEAIAFWDNININAAHQIWIQNPQLNNGNPYRCWGIKDNNQFYVIGAKIASANQNSQIVPATGKPAWTWQKNPGSGPTNDWGTDTHEYNSQVNYDSANMSLSMRTRVWPELRSKWKRFYFNDVSTQSSTGGKIIYKQNRGTTLRGPNDSCGELIEVVSDYGINDNSGGFSHQFPNEPTAQAALVKEISDFTSSKFDYLYLGGTDAEAGNPVPATNDASMFNGFDSLTLPVTPQQTTAAGQVSFTGIGGKRASIDSNGFAATIDNPQLIPNDTTLDDTIGNTHGSIITSQQNGRTIYDRSANILIYTRFQGGDGTTATKAFPGSCKELSDIWYNSSIPDGIYYFRLNDGSVISCDVIGGYIRIPTGTSTTSNPSVMLNSAYLNDSNKYTEYITHSGIGTAATANDMNFDSSNRFNNLSNSATYNENIGYLIWDLGIPFRKIYLNLTVSSPNSTGSGSTNSDWNDFAAAGGWTAGNLPYGGTFDYPFAVVPINHTNQFRALNGHLTQNSQYIQSGGWTGATGDQGVVTRSWQSIVFDCTQSAERTQFGLGFAGFGAETYRFESGYFYIQ